MVKTMRNTINNTEQTHTWAKMHFCLQFSYFLSGKDTKQVQRDFFFCHCFSGSLTQLKSIFGKCSRHQLHICAFEKIPGLPTKLNPVFTKLISELMLSFKTILSVSLTSWPADGVAALYGRFLASSREHWDSTSSSLWWSSSTVCTHRINITSVMEDSGSAPPLWKAYHHSINHPDTQTHTLKHCLLLSASYCHLPCYFCDTSHCKALDTIGIFRTVPISTGNFQPGHNGKWLSGFIFSSFSCVPF